MLLCNDRCMDAGSKSAKLISTLWYRPQYRDMSWQNAHELFPNTQSGQPFWPISDYFCPDAKWIWTFELRNNNIYCRLTLRSQYNTLLILAACFRWKPSVILIMLRQCSLQWNNLHYNVWCRSSDCKMQKSVHPKILKKYLYVHSDVGDQKP